MKVLIHVHQGRSVKTFDASFKPELPMTNAYLKTLLDEHMPKAPKAPAGAKLKPTTPTGAGPQNVPNHHLAHSHYDPAQYAKWQSQGKTVFQIGKYLAQKKFNASKKGVTA